MAFIKTDDREGCFRSEAVTHFTVYSILETRDDGVGQYVTFIKLFSGDFQIAQHLWVGQERLTYENVGGALKRAENSHAAVVAFDDLFKEELNPIPKLSAVS